MVNLYNWGRVAPTWEPRKPAVARDPNDPMPDGLTVTAEIRYVRFQKDGEKIDRIVVFRITAGEFNNCEANYRIKWNRPDKLRPLTDVVMPDSRERGSMVASRDAKVWSEMLAGRCATIVMGVYMGHNYIKEIKR